MAQSLNLSCKSLTSNNFFIGRDLKKKRIPDNRVPLHNDSNRPPSAATGEGSFPQVHLFQPFPNSSAVFDHGVIGGKLEYMLGEAFLSDARAAFLAHLAKPESVTSPVSPHRCPCHVLHTSNLPIRADHLRELNQSCICAKGGCSSVTATKGGFLTASRSRRSGVSVCRTSVGVPSEDSASSS